LWSARVGEDWKQLVLDEITGEQDALVWEPDDLVAAGVRGSISSLRSSLRADAGSPR